MSESQSIKVRSEHYPIQLKSWSVSVGEVVQKDQKLGIYEYIDEEDAKTKRQEIRVPFAGTIQNLANIGDALGSIQEECSHAVQLHGLCALCGQDLSIHDYTGSETVRASINLTHDSRGVTISQNEAARIETATAKHLINSKKLSMLLDLDQTVLHATVDTNIAEWMHSDDTSQQHIRDMTLISYIQSSCGNSYFDSRPGTRKFLEDMSKIYEMHIYTMGTRKYADAVAKVLDPENHYFKDRILSRDESGSFIHKSIQRLFPVDQSMVVAIDDRADVWNWSPNLIKITPCTTPSNTDNFFVGTGDINEPEKEGEEGKEERKSKPEPVKPSLPKFTDNDDDLTHISKALQRLHVDFFSEIENGGSADICRILPRMKTQCLEGVHLLFSGVIPMHQKPQRHHLWIHASQFGATCYLEFTPEITHVVATKLKEEEFLLDPSMMPLTAPLLINNTDWGQVDQELEDALLDDSEEDGSNDTDENVAENEGYGDDPEEGKDDDPEEDKEDEGEEESSDDDWLDSAIDAELDHNTADTVLGKRKFDPSDE